MGNRPILDTLLASIRQGLQGCYFGKQPLNPDHRNLRQLLPPQGSYGICLIGF